MKKFMQRLANPPVDGPNSTIILRLMAGGVFLGRDFEIRL